MFYVYRLMNKFDGKVYIGVSHTSPEARWRKGKGYQAKKIRSAIDRYGWENFEHTIILETPDIDEAYKKEVELIACYKSNQTEYGYNSSIGGRKSALGVKASDETRRKISISVSRIKKGVQFTELHKKHLSECHADFNGAKSPLAKFSQQDIDDIRAVYKPHDKERGRNALAKKYGVCLATIQLIVSGKTYKK